MAEASNTTAGSVIANTLETAGPVQESTTVVKSANTPVETASSTTLPDKTDSALVPSPPAPAAVPIKTPASAETPAAAAAVDAPTPIQTATPVETAPATTVPSTSATTSKSKPKRRGGSKHHTKLKACRSELAGITAEMSSIHATIAALVVENETPEPELLYQLATLEARKAENASTSDAVYKEYDAARKAAAERRQRLESNTATASSTITPTSADLGSRSRASSVSVVIRTSPVVPSISQAQIPSEVAAKPSSTVSSTKTLAASAPPIPAPTPAPARVIRAPEWARLPSKKSSAIPIRAPGSAPLTVKPNPSYEDPVSVDPYDGFTSHKDFAAVPTQSLPFLSHPFVLENSTRDNSCWSDVQRSSSRRTAFVAPTLTWSTDFIPRPPSEASKKSGAASSSRHSSKAKASLKSSKSSSKSAQQAAPKAKATAAPASTPSKAATTYTKSPAATRSVSPSSTVKSSRTTTPVQATPKTKTPVEADASAKGKVADPSLACPRCLSCLSKSPKNDYFSRSLQNKYLSAHGNSSDCEAMQTGGDSGHLFEPVHPAGVSSSPAPTVLVNLPIPPLEVSTMPPTTNGLFSDETTTPVAIVRLPGGPPPKPAGAPAVSASSTEAEKKPKRARRSKSRKQAAAAAASDACLVSTGPVIDAYGDIVIDCDPPILESDISVTCTKAEAASPSSEPSTCKSRRAALRQRKIAAAAAQAELALAVAVSLPESAVSSPIISPLKPVEAVPDIALSISLPVPIIETVPSETTVVVDPVVAAAIVPLPESPVGSPVLAPSEPVQSVSAFPTVELSKPTLLPSRASRIPGTSQRTRSASLSTKTPTTHGSPPVSRPAFTSSKSYTSLAAARSPPLSHAALPARLLRSPSASSLLKTITTSRAASPSPLRPASRSSSRCSSRSASQSPQLRPAMIPRSVSGTSIAGPRSTSASPAVVPATTRPRAASRVSSLEAAGMVRSKSKPASRSQTPASTSRIPMSNPGGSSITPGPRPPSAPPSNPYANYGSRGYDDDYSYGGK